MRRGTRSAGAFLSSLKPEEIDAFLADLSPNAMMALPWLFEHWAHPHQMPPEGDTWKTWVILGGRGAGKTRAGAEWVRTMVEGGRPGMPGEASRVALVAETYDQARDVMIFGESGILASSPPDRKPDWVATKRQLIWPNGAMAQTFSASDPEALRGPQFDAAWVDELAKWRKGRETWDMLQFALRLGDQPRQVVTTTPKDSALLREVMEDERTEVTSAPTRANEAYLAPGFLDFVEGKYGGTRLGRQELDGELLGSDDGALWTLETLDGSRVEAAPSLDRIVVAVDPPVTSGAGADECGIVVVGAELQGPPQDWRAYVLHDGSFRATPGGWAARAVNLYRKWGADRIVAEVNQGGEMVKRTIQTTDPLAAFRGVHATRGKVARAEPVAALYEQGRVFHVGAFRELEDQMCAMRVGGYAESGSPDRVDALVWALTDLMIEPASKHSVPTISSL